MRTVHQKAALVTGTLSFFLVVSWMNFKWPETENQHIVFIICIRPFVVDLINKNKSWNFELNTLIYPLNPHHNFSLDPDPHQKILDPHPWSQMIPVFCIIHARTFPYLGTKSYFPLFTLNHHSSKNNWLIYHIFPKCDNSIRARTILQCDFISILMIIFVSVF